MRRVVMCATFAAVVGLAAATAAVGARQTGPTKLTVWVGWSAGKELVTFRKVAA